MPRTLDQNFFDSLDTVEEEVREELVSRKKLDCYPSAPLDRTERVAWMTTRNNRIQRIRSLVE